jgi:non-specific serine/threonine protein kinase/serine/threonine-protein kinase
MTPERWQRIQEVLDTALKRPLEQREAVLERACRRDPELRREVESLLGHDGTGDYLIQAPALSLAGCRVADYRIVREIGAGGMGVVYEAVQERPVARRVALKLIRQGMETAEVLARFESERQTLALMSHPGIATVFGAGVTEEGRPYFVMEYVEGVPITTYCDGERLDVGQRLDLFVQVCRALEHAHGKGIVHRDVKPSNVLVTRVDGEPVPKVIDFGVAKASDQRLSLRTGLTEIGQMVGTPPYMSPEQTHFSRLAVDRRSDVYSLGALLHELLVGMPPLFGGVAGRAGAIDPEVIRRRIREQEPASLTTRLAELGAEAEGVAARRRTDVRTLRRLLHRDLEWIVQRALAKEPARRYGRAAELGDDVVRYLRSEPVRARAMSTTYRIRRFVRRHRLAASIAAIVTLSLATASTLSTVGLLRARQAEAEARREAAKSAAVAQYLEEILNAGDPEGELGPDPTIAAALAAGLDRIDDHFAEQPEVEGMVRNVIGNAYRVLGRLAEAEAQLRRARSLLEQSVGEEHPDTVDAICNLGQVFEEMGDYRRAEPLLRRALALRRQTGSGREELAWVADNLAVSLFDQGRLAEAEPLFREALELRLEHFGDQHEMVAKTLHNLAGVLVRQGRLAEAEALERRSLDLVRRRLPGPHPGIAYALGSLAHILDRQGKHEAARPLHREAMAMIEATLGPDHWRLGVAHSRRGYSLTQSGDFAEAEAELETAYSTLRRSLGDAHPRTRHALELLMALYAAWGRPQREAETRARLAGDAAGADYDTP